MPLFYLSFGMHVTNMLVEAGKKKISASHTGFSQGQKQGQSNTMQQPFHLEDVLQNNGIHVGCVLLTPMCFVFKIGSHTLEFPNGLVLQQQNILLYSREETLNCIDLRIVRHLHRASTAVAVYQLGHDTNMPRHVTKQS